GRRHRSQMGARHAQAFGGGAGAHRGDQGRAESRSPRHWQEPPRILTYTWRQSGAEQMPHYIALIHKAPDSCYGVSFPDVPGVVTAGDTIDESMQKAVEVLEFAAEDWLQLTGRDWPQPRTIDALRADPEFQEDSTDAAVAAVPFRRKAEAAE